MQMRMNEMRHGSTTRMNGEYVYDDTTTNVTCNNTTMGNGTVNTSNAGNTNPGIHSNDVNNASACYDDDYIEWIVPIRITWMLRHVQIP